MLSGYEASINNLIEATFDPKCASEPTLTNDRLIAYINNYIFTENPNLLQEDRDELLENFQTADYAGEASHTSFQRYTRLVFYHLGILRFKKKKN